MDTTNKSNEKLVFSPKIDVEVELKKGNEVLSKKNFSCKKDLKVSKIAICTASALAAVHALAFALAVKSAKDCKISAKNILKKGENVKCGMMKKAKHLFSL